VAVRAVVEIRCCSRELVERATAKSLDRDDDDGARRGFA